MARAHNAGAAALVMHRGHDNVKTNLGVGLLFSVRSQLVRTPFERHLAWTAKLMNHRSSSPLRKARPSRDAPMP